MDAISYYSREDLPRLYLEWRENRGCETTDIILKFLKKEKAKKSKQGLLVDLGSGPGTSFKSIAQTLKLQKIFAVDAVPAMLALLTEKFAHEGFTITTQIANLMDARVDLDDKSSDFVNSVSLMLYLSNPENLVSESGRVLKKGGYFAHNILLHFNEEMEGPISFVSNLELQCYAHSHNEFQKMASRADLRHISSETIWEEDVSGEKTLFVASLFKKE